MKTIQIEKRYWNSSDFEEMATDWVDECDDFPIPFTVDEMQTLLQAYTAGEHEHSWRLTDGELSEESIQHMNMYVACCVSLRLNQMWLDALLSGEIAFIGFDDTYDSKAPVFPPINLAKVEIIPNSTN